MRQSQALNDIEAIVCQIVADALCVDYGSVTLKSNPTKDFGAEYIDVLDMLFRLEREFQIKLPHKEFDVLSAASKGSFKDTHSMLCVKTICDVIKRKLEERGIPEIVQTDLLSKQA